MACGGGKGYSEMTAAQVLGLPAFLVSYQSYSMLSPEDKTETITKAMEGVTVEIYFGDWNMNSVNYVGAFLKILRTINYDGSKARFFNVDKEPEKRTQIEKEKQLSLYPTFIFFRKNKEKSDELLCCHGLRSIILRITS